MLHLHKGPVRGHIAEERRRKKPSGNQTHVFKSFAMLTCALPLYYNCCPSIKNNRNHETIKQRPLGGLR